jgi:hypothetical protein
MRVSADNLDSSISMRMDTRKGAFRSVSDSTEAANVCLR